MKSEKQTRTAEMDEQVVSPLHPIAFVAALCNALGALGSLLRGGVSDEICTPVCNAVSKRSSILKRLFITASVFLVVYGQAASRVADGVSPVFQVGERLQYKVSWGIFRLGTITMRTGRDGSSDDPASFKVSMLVESNPDLRFVWIWEYYESLLDGTALFSRRFYGRCVNGDDEVEIRGTYDSASRAAVYSQRDMNSGKIIISETLNSVSPFVEGSSLFFLARCLSHTGGASSIPTCVNGRISSTILDFTLPIEIIKVGAIDHAVRVRKYTGTAEWKGGAAGVFGDFTGWVSDDEAAVPIKAEMKVILGSIRIELEQWDRVEWTPPDGLQAANRKP